MPLTAFFVLTHASRMFEIDAWDPETKSIGWTKGGFQGARGNNKGGEWYAENIFEELDTKNEYYYDEDTSMLYYAPNSTTGGPPTGTFEAVINQTIVKLMGTQAKPVEDVKFEGITFRDSAYTYMEPHGGACVLPLWFSSNSATELCLNCPASLHCASTQLIRSVCI